MPFLRESTKTYGLFKFPLLLWVCSNISLATLQVEPVLCSSMLLGAQYLAHGNTVCQFEIASLHDSDHTCFDLARRRNQCCLHQA